MKAPDDCEVSVLYETGHAIGMKLKSGLESLQGREIISSYPSIAELAVFLEKNAAAY